MLSSLKEWLTRLWQPTDERFLLQAYRVAFTGTPHGKLVLQHLLDTVYCTVYEGTDPNEAVAHNARRAVVHEILHNIDLAENPAKYMPSGEDNG